MSKKYTGKVAKRRCHVCGKVMTCNHQAFVAHLRLKCEPPVILLHDRSNEPYGVNKLPPPETTPERLVEQEAEWMRLHNWAGKQ
jgi:hypothetical protein